MSVNSSFSANSSSPLPLPHPSYRQYIFIYNVLKCWLSRDGVLTNVIVMIKSIFMLLPLNFLILYLGCRRRRQQLASHSDMFTFHTSIIELLNVFGIILTSCGIHTNNRDLVTVGLLFYGFNLTGTLYFHTVTCVEHYLAVVHPITYLGLKKGKGVRLRNITVACVWLLCILGSSSLYLTVYVFCFLSVIIIGSSCAAVSFCCISVLRVLNRPGPADRGGERQQVDPSKLRAFHSIIIILSVLLLRLGGSLLVSILYPTKLLQGNGNCHLWFTLYWFCLPSDLVHPLLFLHRAGDLSFCWKRAEPKKANMLR